MLTALLCLGFTLLSETSPPRAALAEQDMIAEIESLGARYSRDAAGEIVAIDLQNAWLTDAELAKLASCPHLERINLSYTKVTDLGLENLAPLENVKVLDLRFAE